MIKQIKEDLARDLNCNPDDIQLMDEKSERGLKVRRLLYNDQGFKITTDDSASSYVNVEPFHPNEQPSRVDIKPQVRVVTRPQANIIQKIKKQKPATLFMGACIIAAIIYVLI